MAKHKPDETVHRAVENAEQALHFAQRRANDDGAHSAAQVAAIDRALACSHEARSTLGSRSIR